MPGTPADPQPDYAHKAHDLAESLLRATDPYEGALAFMSGTMP